jgi:hypothetical protein
MIAFSAFANARRALKEALGMDTSNGTYIALFPDSVSEEIIRDYAAEIGVEAQEGLHCTLLYSRVPIKPRPIDIEAWLPFDGLGDELALFDQNNGKKCLVLKLTSLRIKVVHDTLIQVYGATHDYPTFEAHVTLARDLEPDFKIPEVTPSLKLEFNRYEVKELDL